MLVFIKTHLKKLNIFIFAFFTTTAIAHNKINDLWNNYINEDKQTTILRTVLRAIKPLIHKGFDFITSLNNS